jgi:hypothetical protein
MHYDLFSAPWEQPVMQQAIDTYTPRMTARFILAQHTEKDGYSTILYHPGVKLSDHLQSEHEERHDLTLIIMNLNLFLEHAARNQREPMEVYLYDKTLTEIDQEVPPEFLGGVRISYENSKQDNRQVTLMKETEHEAVRHDSRLFYEREIQAGGRIWTSVVVAVDGTYEPDLLVVLLCGCMIFAASLLLAWVWIMHNRSRMHHVMKIVDKAAAESKIVSSLFPADVREDMIDRQRETDANLDRVLTKSRDAFMNHNGGAFNIFEQDHGSCEKSSEGIYMIKPIAHQYESVTIM